MGSQLEKPQGSKAEKPRQLSAENLQEAKREIEFGNMMTKSMNDIFQCVEENFAKEPDCVKNNAKMTLHWKGKSKVFVSGRGVCEINISYKPGSGKPCYNVTSNSLNIYLERISAGLKVLSIANLEAARRYLDKWETSPSLKACFDAAIRGFQKEPACVQENAKLVIQCNRRNLPFISGQGKCEINVTYSEGRPIYAVNEPTGEILLARLRARINSLSITNLVRVRNRMESFGVMTEELKDCFDYALEILKEAPKRHQENALLALETTTGSLKFKSGKGETIITVYFMNGEFTHTVKTIKTSQPVRK